MLWIICEWPSCRQGLDDVDGDVDDIDDVDDDSGLVAKVD